MAINDCKQRAGNTHLIRADQRSAVRRNAPACDSRKT
jgi:hypothetical protein